MFKCEVSLSSSRMLARSGMCGNVRFSRALLSEAAVAPRDEKVAELRSRQESEIKAAVCDVTISCTVEL